MNSATIIEDLSTPGEILVEEFLEPLKVSQYRLAQATGMDESRVSRIVNGQQSITADSALRLAKSLGTTPEFWLRLQERYDLMHAEAKTDLSQVRSLTA